MNAEILVRLLGPIEARDGDRQIKLAGQRQRTVLAALALRVGRVATVSDLVDAVWGEEPPATARQQVHSAVSALRRALGGVVATVPAGYQLAVPGVRVDVVVFEAQLAEARRAAARGELESAVDHFGEALGLWRGPALGEAPGLRMYAVALEEQRLCAVEEHVDAQLRLGRHTHLVAELSIWVATHPLRERLVGQLMTALYRSGRAGEALAVYRRAESLLADEVGLSPGLELRQLELAVLRADPIGGQ